MYEYQRKSENENINDSIKNTMQFKKEQENNSDNLYSNENRASISEGLIQRQQQRNYSSIPDSVRTQGNSSGLSPENVSSMYHLGKAAQLQAVDRAESATNLFSLGQYNQGEGSSSNTIQRKEENRTGLPDNLKAGVENLSGLSLDDVRVNYNSSKPAAIQAYAYTQGSEIHVGPGKEQYLGHEAWHVVQQKQGRVTPTMQAKGININDDSSLEREADIMGSKAISSYGGENANANLVQKKSEDVVQRWEEKKIFKEKVVPWDKTEKVTTINDSAKRRICFFYEVSGNPIVVKAGADSKEAPGLYNLQTDLLEAVGITSNRMFKLSPNQKGGMIEAIRKSADIASFEKAAEGLGSDLKKEEEPKQQSRVEFEGTFDKRRRITGVDWSTGFANESTNRGNRVAIGGQRIGKEEERKTSKAVINDRIKSFSESDVYVSSYAEGESTEKMSKESAKQDKKDNKMLKMLENESYMKNIGKLAAVDCFMNYNDRVLNGNFGNWMTKDKGDITALDNVGPELIKFWKNGGGKIVKNKDEVVKEDGTLELAAVTDFLTLLEEYTPDKIAVAIYNKILRNIKCDIAEENEYVGIIQAETIYGIGKEYFGKGTIAVSCIENIQVGLIEGKDKLKDFFKNDKKLKEIIKQAEVDDNAKGKYSKGFMNRVRKFRKLN